MLHRRRASACYLLPLLVALPLLGCGRPNAANIDLRKRLQVQDDELAKLRTLHQADQATIAGLQQRNPSIPTLPPQQLERLWVSHGVKFNRMTGGIDTDRTKPGDDAIRCYISPVDETGLTIQAAGSFVIEAFDLAEKGDNHLGRWEFDTIAAKHEWREFLIEYTYAFTCPWQKLPKHPDLTLRVTFTDELTHVPYHAETTIHLSAMPGPATQPTAAAGR